MKKVILGIHGGFSINQHDPAAALFIDGKLIACVEEERLYRVKAPRGMLPIMAIRSCLMEAGITMADVDIIGHPGETYEDAVPRIKSYITHYFGCCPEVKMINHQMAHLASAYFQSGFKEAMCLSYDAYGDRQSAALAVGKEKSGVEIIETRPDINSLGVFYAAMTSFLGFLPAEDEYKVMGLAAMGEAEFDLSQFARPTDDGYIVDKDFLRSDPPLKSNWEPFYSQKLIDICGQPRRAGERITQRHANIAYATQKTLEKCAISLVKYLHHITQLRDLCISGGIGLNCSLNMHIRELTFIDRLFVQPAASDRGLALGCAMQLCNDLKIKIEPINHLYYGPSYKEDDILEALSLVGFEYKKLDKPETYAARLLNDGKIIGWFQGRSEFGPRALGNRSIIADPRPASMKDEVNARIKFREEFRPFAPAVLENEASKIFDISEISPFMTMAFNVREDWKTKLGATTHVNGTARVQTVSAAHNPRFYNLISEFNKLTGVPVLLNTSFNIKGQPIVETPLDAISTFAGTGLDALFLEDYVIEKSIKPRGKKLK